jgi:hypothetical protein
MPLSAGEASEAGVVKASALVPGSSALGRRVIIVDAVHIGGSVHGARAGAPRALQLLRERAG